MDAFVCCFCCWLLLLFVCQYKGCYIARSILFVIVVIVCVFSTSVVVLLELFCLLFLLLVVVIVVCVFSTKVVVLLEVFCLLLNLSLCCQACLLTDVVIPGCQQDSSWEAY